MTIVKICGLRSSDQALAAATAGAHWIGLVFAPSRRQVTIAQATTIVRDLRADPAGQRVRVVGLFVNESPTQINAIAATCGLDYVQLSGTEPPEQAGEIAYPVVKAFRLDGSPNEAGWMERCTTHELSVPAEGTGAGFQFSVLMLVDAHVPGAYGGTGTLADWGRAAALARRYPLLLAGGLTPANVAAAIAEVRPWGVDVSSGVETDGSKDLAKIEAFVRAARG